MRRNYPKKTNIQCDYFQELSLSALCRNERERRLFLALLDLFDYAGSPIEERMIVRHIATIETMLTEETEKEKWSISGIEKMQNQLSRLITMLVSLRKKDKPEPKQKGLLESFNDLNESGFERKD